MKKQSYNTHHEKTAMKIDSKKRIKTTKEPSARLSVLQTLCDVGSEGCRFVSLFITSPYGTSFNTFQKDWIDGKHIASAMSYTKKRRWGKEKRKFCSLLHRLQKEGLVVATKNHSFKITPEGRKKKKLQEEKYRIQRRYIQEPTEKTILVLFDIPERKARYRNWLRSVLKELDYELVQKSVWRGSNAIPKDFLEDIEYFGLISYVEILEAATLGSLEK